MCVWSLIMFIFYWWSPMIIRFHAQKQKQNQNRTKFIQPKIYLHDMQLRCNSIVLWIYVENPIHTKKRWSFVSLLRFSYLEIWYETSIPIITYLLLVISRLVTEISQNSIFHANANKLKVEKETVNLLDTNDEFGEIEMIIAPRQRVKSSASFRACVCVHEHESCCH